MCSSSDSPWRELGRQLGILREEEGTQERWLLRVLRLMVLLPTEPGEHWTMC